MKIIKNVIYFCIRNNMILVPVLLIRCIDTALDFFIVFESTGVDVSQVFSQILDDSGKLLSMMTSIGQDQLEYFRRLWYMGAYYIITASLESIIFYGMIVAAVRNGFSAMEDCWYSIKKYSIAYVKTISFFAVFYMLTGMLLGYSAYLMVSNGVDNSSLLEIISIVLMIIVFSLMVYAGIILIDAAFAAVLLEGSIKKGFKSFFKLSKYWILILAFVILVDAGGAVIKGVFSNLSYLPLIHTINSGIVNSIAGFLKAVFIIFFFRDKAERIESACAMDQYIRE